MKSLLRLVLKLLKSDYHFFRQRSDLTIFHHSHYGGLFQKLGTVVSENVQFAKMFGFEQIDPLLIEIFGDCFTEALAVPPKQTSEASTQANNAVESTHSWSSPHLPIEPPPLEAPSSLITTAGQYFSFPNQTPPQFASSGQPMMAAPFFDHDCSFRLL